MSLGLAEYSYSRVLVCEIYSTQLILIMTSLGHRNVPAMAGTFQPGAGTICHRERSRHFGNVPAGRERSRPFWERSRLSAILKSRVPLVDRHTLTVHLHAARLPTAHSSSRTRTRCQSRTTSVQWKIHNPCERGSIHANTTN